MQVKIFILMLPENGAPDHSCALKFEKIITKWLSDSGIDAIIDYIEQSPIKGGIFISVWYTELATEDEN